MRWMAETRFAIWFAAFALVLGCRDASKDIEVFADRACACADAVCVERVVDDFVAFAKKHKSAKGNETKAAKAAERMMQCATKARVEARVLAEKIRGLAD